MTTLQNVADGIAAADLRRLERKLDLWEHNLSANLARYEKSEGEYSAETIAAVKGQLNMLHAVREVLSGR